MPLPEPNETEERQEFLQRCMRDENIISDFDTLEQRYAVCNSQWEENKCHSSRKH